MGLSTYYQLLKIELQRTTAYRAVMLLSILTGPLFFAVQYFIWKAVYMQQEVVAGYTFASMIQYFVIMTILLYTLHTDASEVIQKRVLHGEMNVILLRPVNMLGELLMRMAGNRGWAMLLEFIPIGILFGIFIGPEVLLPKGNWPVAVILVPIGMLLVYLLRYIIGLTAFWTQKNHGLWLFVLFLGFFMTGMMFPLDVTPMWAQQIMVWTPWPYMLFAPAAIWTGTYSLAGVTNPYVVLACAIGYLIVLYILAVFVQKRAYLKYQGVGQ